MRDPADDGPEVNLILFFRMCPNGAQYLRVGTLLIFKKIILGG